MRTYTRIRLFAAICMLLVVASCTKEQKLQQDEKVYDFVKVELSLDTKAASSTEQGDQIKDVTVWAYRITGTNNGVPVIEQTPCGWGTASYSGVYESTEAVPLYMELPYVGNGGQFRFMAVVNNTQFGTIYKALTRSSNTLSEFAFDKDTRYSDLATAIFDASITGIAPNAAALPVSHWKDVTVSENNLSEDADGNITLTESMTVYRALAKGELYAKLSEKSAQNNVGFEIVKATIKSADNLYVADKGFVFQGFGSVQDITHSQFESEPINSSSVTLSAAPALVGSAFLYENPSSAAAYTIEIVYRYNGNTNTVYAPLPVVVRNNIYRVNAEFDVKLNGELSLNYNVVEWVSGEQNNEEVVFEYPTLVVSAVKTVVGNSQLLDYSQPVTYWQNGEHGGAFAFNFTMSAPVGTDDHPVYWYVSIDNPLMFDVAVYKEGVLQTVTDINGNVSNATSFPTSDTQYQIKVYPKYNYNENSSSGTIIPATNVGISYNAWWMGGSEYLLINAKSTGTLWEMSGGQQHLIKVIQVPAPDNATEND